MLTWHPCTIWNRGHNGGGLFVMQSERGDIRNLETWNRQRRVCVFVRNSYGESLRWTRRITSGSWSRCVGCPASASAGANGRKWKKLQSAPGLWPAPVHWWWKGSALLWRAELLDWLKAEGSLNPLLARCPSPSQLDHCDGELDCVYSKSNFLDQWCCVVVGETWGKVTKVNIIMY